MSEVYSHMHEELEMRLVEAERVGYGFDLPEKPASECCPDCPEKSRNKKQ
jgi:hypothetical protein